MGLWKFYLSVKNILQIAISRWWQDGICQNLPRIKVEGIE